MECYMGYTSAESKIIRRLESHFMEFADGYKLQEWEIPALISGDVLKKCGYFRTMPNQLTSVGYINKQAIDEVINKDNIEESDVLKSNFFLTPAACIHLYPMISGQQIRNELITTRARVYRYEDAKFEEGTRLWDFGVREFVAVGTPEFVKSFLVNFQEKSLEYASQCGIECQIISSNDHFYPTKNNEMMKKMQKANGLKMELVCKSNQLAIASYNYHGSHFSKPFNFDDEGSIVTGCVGFGLDRWISMINRCEEDDCEQYIRANN